MREQTGIPGQCHPLSLSQKNIWNLEQAYPRTSINNICTTIHIQGRFELELVRKSLRHVLRLDASLRTRLCLSDGEPVQYVADDTPEPFPVFDFSMTRTGGLAHWEQAVAREVMPLYDAPLYSFLIFRLGEDAGGVLVKTHHVISDGWSQVQLSNRIAAAYLAYLAGEEPEEQPPPAYTQHVEEERLYLDSAACRRDEAYWREQLTVPAEPAAIKECKSASVSPVGRRRSFRLSDVLNHAIQSFCTRQRVAPFAVLYMALAIYLKRIGGADRFCIGVPILNRVNFSEKQTTGMFVSTLPFVNELDENWTFSMFNEQLMERWYDLLRHQKYPFEKIQALARELHPDASRLFHLVLSYQNSKIMGNKETTVRFTGRWHYSGYQAEDLCIHLSSMEDLHAYSIDYDYLTQIFSEREIEDIHGYLTQILSRALIHPDQPIWQIPMIGEAETEKVLFGFNRTDRPLYADSIYEELAAVSGEYPERVAVIWDGKRMTHRDLQRRAEVWDRAIRRLHPDGGAVAAVLLPRGFALLEALVGVARSGNTWLLLPYDLPRGRVREILSDSAAALLLTDRQALSDGGLDGTPAVLAEELPSAPADEPDPAAPAAPLAYLVYTSGSTGAPKGVAVGPRSLLNFARACAPLYAHGAALSVCSPGFDAFLLETVAALLNGRTVVLAAEWEKDDPAALAALIRNYAVGFLAVTPSRLEAYLHTPAFAHALRRLESIVFGGEPLSGETLRKVEACTGARLYNQYGPSETTVGVSCRQLNGAAAVTIGKPMDNCRLYILDGHLQPLPIGAYGDLYIGGLCVGEGYYRAPELTEASFIPSPFEPGERLYRSGDVGCWTADGEIVLAGRKDQQLKLRGLRIEPQEIAARLAAHPRVRQAAVRVWRQDGQTLLIGYYTVDGALAEAELLRFAAQYLPSYMLPARLIQLSELPLSASGKIDTARLPAPAADAGARRPETELQRKLLSVFRRVLRNDAMGVESDYFLSGGDSLNAAETVAVLERELDVSLKLADLYALRTVRLLAQHLGEQVAPPSTAPALTPAPLRERYPLSPAQQSLYVQAQLDPQSLAYNMPGAFRLPDGVSVERLRDAFERLIVSEELLRTRFGLGAQGAYQQVLPVVPFAMPTLEAGSFAEACADFVRPFDLAAPPLLRAALWREQSGRLVLLVDLHHIVSDGISTPLLLRRLDALYQGAAVESPALFYKDYAWYLAGREPAVCEAQRSYWRERLADAGAPLELPTDRPRPKRFDYAGRKYAFALDEPAAAACAAFCRMENVTPYMLFMAVFGVLVSKISGSEDLTVGTPVSGRRMAELWEMFGPFLNTLPLRLQPAADKPFRAYLAEVERDVIALQDHQDVPLEELIAMSGANRELSVNPLYQTMLSYRPLDSQAFTLDGAPLEYLPIDDGSAKLELNLEARAQGEGYAFVLEYATALFEDATAAFYARCFTALLASALEEPNRPIGALHALAAADRFRLYDRPQRRRTPFVDLPVDTLADQMAALQPEQPAIVFHGAVTSYGEVRARSDALAAYLLEQGTRPGDRIAVCCRRGPDLICALLGVLKAGCAYVPMLSSFPENRLRYMLETAGAALLLCDGACRAELPADLGCPLLAPDFSARPFAPVAGRSGEDAIHVLFTSGSTGQPKGVVLRHRSLSNLLVSVEEMFADVQGAVLCVSNVVFDTFITETLFALAMGRRIVLADEEEMLLPWRLAELICQEKVGYLQLTPSRMQMCLGNEAFAEALGRLELLFLMGETLPPALLERVRSLGRGLRVYNLYGPTETTVYATACDVSDGGPIRLGKPLHNCRLYTLDHALRPVLPTARGEIYLAGECLAAGYAGRPDLTEALFLPDPFYPGERMYKSGDLGRLMLDGSFDFAGRRDRQVKLNGQRIELDEITGEILRSGLAAEAAVVAARHDDGSMELRAYVVPQPGGTDAEARVRAHLHKWLPSYMMPSIIQTVAALPKTATGKTDALALAAQPPTQEQAAVPPLPTGSDVREELRAVWARVLGRDEVAEDVSFFEQGGTSLGALHLLNEYFGRKWTLSLSELYEHPTLAEQAALLCKAVSAESSAPTPRPAAASTPAPAQADAETIRADGEDVLLTGATGFLGAHLAAALLDAGVSRLYCLVRGGAQRLADTLTRYFGAAWYAERQARLTALEGDVTCEQFGLTALPAVRTVLHAAADVRHFGDAAQAERVNCGGARNAAALARSLGARLLHVSTISVSGEYLVEQPARKAVFSETDYEIGQNWRDNIYVRSKFLAERVVREAMQEGLDAKIFRVGRLVGRQSDGVFQAHPETNTFYQLVRALRRLPALPASFADLAVELTAVDECAAAIVALRNGRERVYHVCNPKELTLRELARSLRGEGTLLDDEAFESLLRSTAASMPPEALSAAHELWNRARLHPFHIFPTAVCTQKELYEYGFDWTRPDPARLLRSFL